MSKKAVVVYSGGMDSFTLLHKVRQQGFEVFALSFNYGQRHAVELTNHRVVDISSINSLIGGSSLTSDVDVPEGHYEEESMKSTVVPNRNMILLSLAVGYAVSIESGKVFYGAHSGDHGDCYALSRSIEDRNPSGRISDEPGLCKHMDMLQRSGKIMRKMWSVPGTSRSL